MSDKSELFKQSLVCFEDIPNLGYQGEDTYKEAKRTVNEKDLGKDDTK